MNADNEGFSQAVGSGGVMDDHDGDVASVVQGSRSSARSLSDIHLHPVTPAEYSYLKQP